MQRYKILFYDSSEALKDRLIRETSLALHETVGVRLEGLQALQSTVKNSSEIQSLIIGSDEPDPCVTTLLDGLVCLECTCIILCGTFVIYFSLMTVLPIAFKHLFNFVFFLLNLVF